MAEELKLPIVATYEGAGAAKQAVEDQNQIAAANERANKAGAGGTGGDVATERIKAREAAFERYAAQVAGADAAEITAEQQKAMELERQLVTATQRAQIEAAIAGDATEVKKLTTEQAIRRMTIATLREEVMTQEQLNAFIAEQNVLIERSNAAITARAAAEATEGQGKVHGRAGHLGHLLENFGVSENFAITAGMGLMFGMEANRLVKEYAEHLEKINEENEKAGESATERVQKTREELENARSLADVLKIQTGINNDLGALYKKREQSEGEELTRINMQIQALEASARWVETNWRTAILRKTAEQEIKEVIEAQKTALEDSIKLQQRARAEIQLQLQLWKEVADAEMKAAMAKVNADEKSGVISHKEAARRREELTGKHMEDTRQHEIEAMQKERDNLTAQAAELKKNREESDATFRMARDEAEQAANALAAKRNAEAKQQAAAQAAEQVRYLETALPESGLGYQMPTAKKNAARAEEIARKAAEGVGPESVEELGKTAKDKALAQEVAKKAAEEMDQKAKGAEALLDQARLLDQKIAAREKAGDAEKTAQNINAKASIEEAQNKDQQIALEAQIADLQARLKSVEDSGKRNPRFAEDVRRLVALQNQMLELRPGGLPASGAERELILSKQEENTEAGEQRIRQHNKMGKKEAADAAARMAAGESAINQAGRMIPRSAPMPSDVALAAQLEKTKADMSNAQAIADLSKAMHEWAQHQSMALKAEAEAREKELKKFADWLKEDRSYR